MIFHTSYDPFVLILLGVFVPIMIFIYILFEFYLKNKE